PDPRPEVGEAAARRLEVVLADRPALLHEWLALALAADRRVPHVHLAELLERAARDSDLRPAVAAAIGPRGTWLAGFNKAWSFVMAQPLAEDVFAQEDWDQGTRAQRLRALTALRAQDPATALDLLTRAWSTETRGEVRRDLLGVLEIRPGTEDATLLDTALDDRNASVRGRALALLTGLPDSAHAHRLRDHLRRHLRVDREAPRPVDVSDPSLDDTALLRDLSLTGSRKTPEPERERWERTRTLVTHTPLDVWTDLLDTDPAGVLALVADHPDLRGALLDAVALQGNAVWARVVLDHPSLGLARMTRVGRHQPRHRRIGPLLAPLPVEERCARVLAVVDRAKSHYALDQALSGIDAPWTRELSEAVARRLTEPPEPTDLAEPAVAAGSTGSTGSTVSAEATESRRRDLYGHDRLCATAAEFMRPQDLDLLPEQPPNEEQAHPYLTLRDTLRFRLDMHREL
ncbi:DUF5691 domain-containing protein, partial [Nocardiopsis sp. MG754419]|uniref:DUF5691 domain-containing protein n=1 Tax=Nocardiopsis sp. MG754419 TaxID=2259865 RepID=UPI001BA696BA